MAFHLHLRQIKLFMSILAVVITAMETKAQVCPPNIDFEKGDFSSWTTYTGGVSAGSGQNEIFLFPSSPEFNRHTMYSRATSSNVTDFYGGFPVLCPNGSGYSVKLGNNSGGTEAEGLSYEFTIPANRNTYSLTYHYAVVFQDPHHQEYEQPRLEIEVKNITDNEVINCSSLTFIPFGAPLPGFFISPQSDSTAVWCKNWTAVTINLNGKAGKTIRLFLKTADCTFRRHFGYAYIDVNSECSGEFTGATYCPTDTLVNLVAPYGFESYTWYNKSFSQVLGKEQNLTLQPPPPAGQMLAVVVTPYFGYGCSDTLYARLIDTLTVKANAGPDVTYCGTKPVIIGENPKPGLRYQWTPTAGLSDATISNPFASPNIKTQYRLTVTSNGGGCIANDLVTVNPLLPDTSLQIIGKTDFCSISNDSAVLILSDANTIQWYVDNIPITAAKQNRFRILKSGNYYAIVTNKEGCSMSTRSVKVNIEQPIPGIAYPVQYTFVNTALQLESRALGVTTIWKPSVYLSDPSLFKPSFNSNVEIEQKYLINITTAAGCLTTDTQIVKVIKAIEIFVPNAFTPNHDGLNDKLFPVANGIKEILEFKVFNRWGREIYSISKHNSGWDGTLNGIEQEMGLYVWLFKALGIDNKIYIKKGFSTLIR